MTIEKEKNFLKHFKLRIKPNKRLCKRFEERLELFLKNSSDPVLQDHPLSGDMTGFRSFSITGDIRVLYERIGDEIRLYDIGSHNQVYR